jgi:hypothetical protein
VAVANVHADFSTSPQTIRTLIEQYERNTWRCLASASLCRKRSDCGLLIERRAKRPSAA